VDNGAYIGIASHAEVDQCWDDKVLPILSEEQFPSLTESLHYNNPTAAWQYPKLDDKNNWNCLGCAYHMNSSIDKPEGVRRVMTHYGLDPNSPTDRARVIFWDDSPTNVNAMISQMPEARTILVPRVQETGEDGGCGVTPQNIEDGWTGLEPACAP
jgi:hypothetical protein